MPDWADDAVAEEQARRDANNARFNPPRAPTPPAEPGFLDSAWSWVKSAFTSPPAEKGPITKHNEEIEKVYKGQYD